MYNPEEIEAQRVDLREAVLHARPFVPLYVKMKVFYGCNLKCEMCNHWRERREPPVSAERFKEIIGELGELGTKKIHISGGEPLLRRDLPALIERLARKPSIRDLAMTTNAVLLAPAVGDLKRAGLGRLTISLDTLQRDRFIKLARFDELPRVLAGIDAAVDVFPGFKLDTVVIRGVNDDEILPLLGFAKARGAELRFIEYMDVGGATNWSMSQVVSRDDLLKTIGAHYGPAEPLGENSSAPADRYRLPDGTIFGIIASTTEPFCRACDRSRLTADGMWYLCLYAPSGTDLRAALRSGASPADLAELVRRVWEGRADRGAEGRLAARDRESLIPLERLKRDPHLEMHTRGG